jgi:hypothetical protein
MGLTPTPTPRRWDEVGSNKKNMLNSYMFILSILLISTPYFINAHMSCFLAILLWVGSSLLINMGGHPLKNHWKTSGINPWLPWAFLILPSGYLT